MESDSAKTFSFSQLTSPAPDASIKVASTVVKSERFGVTLVDARGTAFVALG